MFWIHLMFQLQQIPQYALSVAKFIGTKPPSKPYCFTYGLLSQTYPRTWYTLVLKSSFDFAKM